MKLLTKNTLVLLIVTLLVFCLGGIVFYLKLQEIVNEEAAEALFRAKREIERDAHETGGLTVAIPGIDWIDFTEASGPDIGIINDTLIYTKEEKEYLPFKQLSFSLNLKGNWFRAQLRKSLFESDDLIETILRSFIIILALLTVVFVLINYFFSRLMWKPFLAVLKLVNEYKIEKHKSLSFPKTNTIEFQQLNEALKKMTQKIADDYDNLKSFTENASHELQTPLAVIRNKTEMLMQSPGLTQEQIREIIEINLTAERLSKLNQSLLLLSKIDNQQFESNQEIDFTQIVKKKMEHFSELADMKSITITAKLELLNVKMHPLLAEILVTNLLSNAIKYTSENGFIEVVTRENTFEVSNTGKPLKSNGENLFNRFYKESEDSASTGLGLALVRQIALANNHWVSYKFEGSKHLFTYFFSS